MRNFSATKFMICLSIILGLGIPSLAAVYPVVWQKASLIDPATTLQLSKLSIGDYLDISNPQTLPIYKVSKAQFDGCLRSPDEILIGRQAVTTFQLTETGDIYLMSDYLDCQEGLKLHLKVSP